MCRWHADGRRPGADHPGRRPPHPGDAGDHLARPGGRALRAAAGRAARRCGTRWRDPRPTNTTTAPGCRPSSTRSSRKLAAENGIDVGRGSRIMVTAGANMAFMHAVLATTMPGDEVILPVPFYFNHEMAIEMAGCRAVPRADRRSLPASPRRDSRARSPPRTRAIVTDLAEQPERRGAVRRLAPRAERALPRARAVSHLPTRPTSTSPTVGAAHVSPASFPDASSHTISLYSLSKAYGFAGWRIGYMVYPAASGVGDDEEPGHDPDLPADRVAGRARWRRCRSAARTASPTCASWRRSATSWSTELSALAPLATRAGRRRRVLLSDEGEHRPRPDGVRRTADSRAPGRGHSRVRRSA